MIIILTILSVIIEYGNELPKHLRKICKFAFLLTLNEIAKNKNKRLFTASRGLVSLHPGSDLGDGCL